MQATFYINKSDEIVVNKNLTPVSSNVTLYFKSNESTIRPTFKMTGNYSNLNVNYIYITDLKKYYYVENITYSQQCIYLECKEDVLMTWKTYLLAQEVILKRQENKYNLYQDDSEFRLLGFDAIRTQEFPGGFEPTTQTFILGMVGKTSGGE